jgi:hypothetical protein
VPKVTLDETRVGHVFRDAAHHFRDDNAANRQALIEVASRRGNLVGTDRFDNAWFAEIRTDGTQVCPQVRGRVIVNGGLNRIPHDFRLP